MTGVGGSCRISVGRVGSTRVSPALRFGFALSLTGALGATSIPAHASSTPATLPTYQGGLVMQPTIIPIYWGNYPQSTIDSLNQYLQGLAQYVSGNMSSQGKEPTVYQYGVQSAIVGTAHIDTSVPSGTVNDSDVRNEIAKFGPYNIEDIVMVFMDGTPGTDAKGEPYCAYGVSPCYCSYHALQTGHEIYTVNPFPSSGGPCAPHNATGSMTQLDLWEARASHVFFGAATNPNAGTSGGTDGWSPDIGDQCDVQTDPGNSVTMSFGVVQTVADKQHAAEVHGAGSCSVWSDEQSTSIAATSPGVAILDVAALDLDNNILHIRQTNRGWSPWDSPNDGRINRAPVIASSGSSGFDLFAQGTDNNLYHRIYDGTNWGGWTLLGGPTVGQPSVVLNGSTYYIFLMGTDGTYYYGTAPAAGPWGTLSLTRMGTTLFNGAPVAVGTSSEIHVFGWGDDGTYYENVFTPVTGHWSGWNNSAFASTRCIGDPTATSGLVEDPNSLAIEPEIDLFCQLPTGGYHHQVWLNGSWTSSDSTLTGPFLGRPALAFGLGQVPNSIRTSVEVVAEGTDLNYYESEDFVPGNFWQFTTQPLNDANGFGALTLQAVSWGPILGGNEFFALIGGQDHQMWYTNKQNGGASWDTVAPLGGKLH